MRHLFITFAFVLSSLFAFSQITKDYPFQIDSEIQYGGSLLEVITDIVQTDDGGFLCIGHTESYGTGYYGHSDLWLVKTDALGNKEWDKTFGQADSLDKAYSILETSDGNYLIAGERLKDIIYGDGWEAVILKIDSDGNEIWEKKYGGGTDDSDIVRFIQETSDGGFIACGATSSFGAEYIDAWILKIDADGNEEWNQNYGEEGYEVFKQVYETEDNGFIAAGFTNSDFGNGSYDYYIVKTDSEGNQEWVVNYGDQTSNRAYYFMPIENGNYLLAGGWSSGAADDDVFDLNIMEISPTDGAIVRQETYADTTNCEPLFIVPSTDNGYMLACKSGFAKSAKVYQTDLRFVKLNEDYELVADTLIGYLASETPNVIHSFKDNSYLVAGYTMSTGGNSGDAWFVKITDLIAPAATEELVKNNINIYPNPSNGTFTIQNDELQIKNIEISDITGRIIFNATRQLMPLQINISNHRAGIYFVTIQTEKRIYTQKIIIN